VRSYIQFHIFIIIYGFCKENVENDATGRMVYGMFFLRHYFLPRLLFILKHFLKMFKNLTFSKNVGFPALDDDDDDDDDEVTKRH